MADFKNKTFLSFEGLDLYTSLIKELIKNTKGDVEAAIELAVERIAKLEGIVGDGQLAELGADVRTLTMAVLGEATRAKAAEGALSEKINSLNQDLEWGQLGGAK